MGADTPDIVDLIRLVSFDDGSQVEAGIPVRQIVPALLETLAAVHVGKGEPLSTGCDDLALVLLKEVLARCQPPLDWSLVVRTSPLLQTSQQSVERNNLVRIYLQSIIVANIKTQLVLKN